ncbi:MAG: DUF2339 domain-containing protein [Proteobacteria bacterium]|nr:DUF2339 domain-containing protein [Pseudomonadota bacterium]
MAFVAMLVGAVLGAFFCAGLFDERIGLSGALFGALFGWLFVQTARLRQRVDELHRDFNLLRIKAAAQAAAAAPKPTPAEAAPPPPPMPPRPLATPPSAPVPETAAAGAMAAAAVVAPAAGRPVVITPPTPVKPDPLTQLAERVKRWFSEGNVPVKVGMIVLFLGIGALLKYATDSGWLRLPIELRLAGIAAAALAGIGFAWRKRESHRTFALSVQGGAIGILLLTIFAAYRNYAALPAGLAFALLVAIVAGAGVLAVLQDALALAVLAIVGGFLAPILTSSGSGHHVALFGYYAVLNAAIFAIAWIRPWRALNLLGFAFTFGVGTLWGVLKYRSDQFATTEPFLLLFFAFYLLIPVFYARRLEPERRDFVDGSLVFGTPLVAFALQAGLLYPQRLPLAYSALGAAAIYSLLGWAELRRFGLRLLGQSHALLALGFATLAVPLALSARWTATTWAIEGAALVWFGLRQQRRLPRWIGYGLQFAAACALSLHWSTGPSGMPVLNGEFLGAVLIALAGLASARLLHRAGGRLALPFFLWAWLWWTVACGHDIARLAPDAVQADWWLALFAITGAIGAEAFRRLDWPACAMPALALFALAPPLIVFTAVGNHGALEGWGAAAWALWLACALRSLSGLAARAQPLTHIAHAAFAWTVALVIGVELWHWTDAHLQLATVWVWLAALAPLAALFWCVLARAGLARWPDAEAAERSRTFVLASLALVLGCAWLAGLFAAGDPVPLPFLPVLNPLELALLGWLLSLLAWFRRAAGEGRAFLDAEFGARALAIAFFVLLTDITLRGTHFLGGVPWSEALQNSPLAQAALSIVWTLAGIATMLLGKRRGSRAVWIGGSVLMGVVIVKLLLVDRQHLQDLTAIVGVLVVGALLVGVGYFAPAPPRATGEKS